VLSNFTSSPTASGKTVLAEVSIARELYEKDNGKVIYLSPLKSLTDEKLVYWQHRNHLFNKYNIECITGDYVLTDKKNRSLKAANIILMTSEMLDSKTRNLGDNSFLLDTSLLVIDEVHLLHMKQRGDKLESAIIRFLKHFPNCRLVMISATIPNFVDLKTWINKISERDTEAIESGYRSVTTKKKYVKVREVNPFIRKGKLTGYQINQEIRKNKVLDIISQIEHERGSEQVLVFVGSIQFGSELCKELKGLDYNAEFHSSMLNLEKRRDVEDKFKTRKIQVLVCTSTLAWGVNLPAKNVIIANTTYGSTKMEIYDLLQMMGRSGRPGFDDSGFVYILTTTLALKKDIENPPKMESRILENLRFHILCEIQNGEIYDQNSLEDWYDRTFSSVLYGDCNLYIDDILDDLYTYGFVDKNRYGNYMITQLGKIPVMMYFDPMDILFWYNSMKRLDPDFNIDDDILIAQFVGNNYTWNQTIVPKKQKKLIIDRFQNPLAQSLYNILSGSACNSYFKKFEGMVIKDMDRIIQAINLLDGFMFYGKFKEKLNLMKYRIKYRVPSKQIKLVSIEGIGGVFADRLFSEGIKDKIDLLKESNKTKVLQILGEKRYNTIKLNLIHGA